MKDESVPEYVQEEYDNEDAWNEAVYGDEEDEEVAEAMKQAAKEKELEKMIAEIRIEYKPADY
jgi:hypothetical protein